MHLNLGCSDGILPGLWINVDITPPADQLVDLNGPWPWADNSVTEIRAYDVLEHLKSPIHMMNEAWRVLCRGGRFDIVVPTTDGRGWAQDPTHVCWPPWNRNSFFYYTAGNAHLTRFAPQNGVRCAFRVVSEEEHMLANKVSKLHIVLEAVK
jgi:hypothetical protein